MKLLKILKFTFAINQINESDLKELGIPKELCKDVCQLLSYREN
ncbi:hypothetical protein [Halalkalibacter okhensis]|nr:hypothetical protein [Halalkalibacter okhensis]